MLRRTLLNALTTGGFLLWGKEHAFAAEEASLPNDLLKQGYALFSAGKSWLGLKILGYQFPGEVRDPYDSNWLMVSGHVGLNDQSWSFKDPCLLTTEVALLADWLVAITSNKSANNDCGFIEPNLYFHRIKPTHIRIRFSLEAKPPWAAKGDFETEYGFDMPITSALWLAADNLRQQLEVFPKRG